jgi:drug/metabolite transporter (DMT)-like permease
MSIQYFLSLVFIAFGFVGWPIIGSYSGASGGWVSVILCASTMITVTLFSIKELSGIPIPATKALVLLFIAGAFNGLAVCFYSIKITDASISTAVLVVTVSILMVMAAPILDWLIKGAIPSLYQALGYTFAICAIYFLNK